MRQIKNRGNLAQTLFPHKEGRKPGVHFIGVGGIGVSALARWFLAQKWAVSGSDLTASSLTKDLSKEGVWLKIGHKKAHIPSSVGLVICTSAIRRENPEFREVKRRRIPVLTYPEAIGRITRAYRTVGVAGSHGKSTTTALVGLILRKAKKDPTVVVGTKLREFAGKNFRKGKSDILVLESDEWAGAFRHYSPSLALVTNIDREHLDFYKNLTRIKKAFLEFLSHVLPGGTMILNAEDKNLFSLKHAIEKIARKRNVEIKWYRARSPLGTHLKKMMMIPGTHNLSNACGAVVAARTLGVPDRVSFHAVHNYRGAWRRMEYRGTFQVSGIKCQVYDDYGHHPTEIKATLKAFKEKFPNRPLICVYQPHQAKRLQALFKEFRGAFDAADTTLLMPLYQVPGRDEKIDPRFDSESLVRAIQKQHPKQRVFYLANPRNLSKALSSLLLATDYLLPPIIVMMGAGNIVDYTDTLVR